MKIQISIEVRKYFLKWDCFLVHIFQTKLQYSYLLRYIFIAQ